MEPFGIVVDGWKYTFDLSRPIKKRLRVDPPDQIETPDFLYKYYSLSAINIDALNTKYLYAASKFEMNDDFDCLENLIDMHDVPDDYIFKFYKEFHADDYIKKNFDDLKKNFPKIKTVNYNGGFGVVSLTENLYSPTMWAHYANSNHGFAVKFNLENFDERLIGPFPVNYRPDWIPIPFPEEVEIIAFLYMTNIKSSDWKYEKEWRYIGLRPNMSYPPYKVEPEFVENRKFSYSPKAIEEIILGSRFFDGMVQRDVKNNRVLLETNSSEKNGIEKKEVLVLITVNKLKTSRIVHREGSKTFELDSKPVEITRIEENLFEVKL